MNGYVSNLTHEVMENEDFRRVVYTAKRSQLVLMSLQPNEEIGEEIHEGDQIIHIESGFGTATLEGEEHQIANGSVIFIPEGVRHNIINGSDEVELKLYTIYVPPEHKEGAVQHTKEQVEGSERIDEDQIDIDE